jgi:hypothetical protein
MLFQQVVLFDLVVKMPACILIRETLYLERIFNERQDGLGDLPVFVGVRPPVDEQVTGRYFPEKAGFARFQVDKFYPVVE